jgi:hypothetical protein
MIQRHLHVIAGAWAVHMRFASHFACGCVTSQAQRTFLSFNRRTKNNTDNQAVLHHDRHLTWTGQLRCPASRASRSDIRGGRRDQSKDSQVHFDGAFHRGRALSRYPKPWLLGVSMAFSCEYADVVLKGTKTVITAFVHWTAKVQQAHEKPLTRLPALEKILERATEVTVVVSPTAWSKKEGLLHSQGPHMY